VSVRRAFGPLRLSSVGRVGRVVNGAAPRPFLPLILILKADSHEIWLLAVMESYP
jgi:hypothetical protein